MNRDSFKHHADKLDQDDVLAPMRDKFHIPANAAGDEFIYLCGNSLGLQPKSVAGMLGEELEDWKTLGVEGHFHARRPWMPYHELLTEKMAALVGAKNSEVVCMNTLTVNLHLMMVSFYRPTPRRHKILIEAGAFPSDRYAVESQIIHHGFDPKTSLIEFKPRANEQLDTKDICDYLASSGHEVAQVLLPGVQYYSGQVLDIKAITAAAHAAGCTIGWDLAHSVGNVPVALHDSNADYAVWCNYKYMNAGPGAIGGCFVHQRHASNPDIPRFAGWWGNDKSVRFKMGPEFCPIPTAEGWQLSNPSVFSMTPLLASLEIFAAVGIDALHKKSLHMGRLLIDQLQRHFSSRIHIVTPTEDDKRGGQLSLRAINGGRHIQQGLIDAGVICDWREPDCIRIAFAPLYNRYRDIYRFTDALERVMEQHD